MMQLYCNGILNNLVDCHEYVMFVGGEFRGDFTLSSRFFQSKGFLRFLMDFLKSKKDFCQRCTRFFGNQ